MRAEKSERETEREEGWAKNKKNTAYFYFLLFPRPVEIVRCLPVALGCAQKHREVWLCMCNGKVENATHLKPPDLCGVSQITTRCVIFHLHRRDKDPRSLHTTSRDYSDSFVSGFCLNMYIDRNKKSELKQPALLLQPAAAAAAAVGRRSSTAAVW